MFSRNTLRIFSNFNKINVRNFGNAKILLNKKEYTDSEEWLFHSDEYTKIGITKNAAEQFGDLVFIEHAFEENEEVKKGEELVVLESVKATESINAPFNCIVIENNEDVTEKPELINEDPENVDDSWLIKIEMK